LAAATSSLKTVYGTVSAGSDPAKNRRNTSRLRVSRSRNRSHVLIGGAPGAWLGLRPSVYRAFACDPAPSSLRGRFQISILFPRVRPYPVPDEHLTSGSKV